MENKEIIGIISAFIIFTILVFATPFMENRYSSTLWMLFFIFIFAIILIAIIKTLIQTPKHKLIDDFKNKHIIIQILDIASIILLIYSAITLKNLEITTMIICLTIILETLGPLSKKEEE